MKGNETAIIASAIALCALAAGNAQAETTIRYVPSADINVLDPVTNHSFVVTQFAFMVYDQLFAIDSKFNAKPQMVDTYTKSDDGLTYRFTLRKGLKFSDGGPVTSADAIGSIDRWSKNDPAGAKMIAAGMKMSAVDDATFQITFQRRFDSVIDVMAKPSWPLFVFPARDTTRPPTEAVTDAIGSGPFRFVKSEWQPGAKLVFEKNPDYVPRAEPADGFAGGKVVKVDRVEWNIMPDANTAVAALQNGEVDAVENIPVNLAVSLKQDPKIAVDVLNKIGILGYLRLNHVQPPFNNAKAREALMYLVNQGDYMRAMVGDQDYWSECWAFMMCGSKMGSETGAEPYKTPDPEKAKKLLAESGYDGRPIVIFDSTGVFGLRDQAQVLAQELQSIGANVELRTMDFNTMLKSRGNADTVDKGGWNIEPLWSPGLDFSNPISNYLLTAPCAITGYPGWACDPEIEKLRDEWAATPADQQKAVADKIQAEAIKLVPGVPVGQFYQPIAYRKSLSGLLQTPYLAMWNITKSD